MRVSYSAEGGKEPATELLSLLAYDEAKGVTSWKVADVRANREKLKKGQPLPKKVRERRLELPNSALLRLNLHMDV